MGGIFGEKRGFLTGTFHPEEGVYFWRKRGMQRGRSPLAKLRER